MPPGLNSHQISGFRCSAGFGAVERQSRPSLITPQQAAPNPAPANGAAAGARVGLRLSVSGAAGEEAQQGTRGFNHRRHCSALPRPEGRVGCYTFILVATFSRKRRICLVAKSCPPLENVIQLDEAFEVFFGIKIPIVERVIHSLKTRNYELTFSYI